MLTKNQITEYRQNGYTVYPNFLSPDEVAALLAETEKITHSNTLAKHDKTRMEMEPDQPPDGTRVRRLYEPCTYYPLFKAFSESEKLLDTVEQLLGPDILFHYSKLNMKPPQIGSVVEWHQDLSYYPLTNRDSLAVLFYLDDADAENGCLQIIPNCHEGCLLDHTREGYFQGRVTETVDASKAVLVEGKSCAAIFMHCMAPHASTTNCSNRYRRTLILSYRAADAFPVFCGEMTVGAEAHVRLVRGRRIQTARFTMTEFPIPRYKQKSTSLYELQERSRKQENNTA
jgi:ectoine hydroxylase-related dioxygenase (phytanoyl-CoA dioxygenase family)